MTHIIYAVDAKNPLVHDSPHHHMAYNKVNGIVLSYEHSNIVVITVYDNGVNVGTVAYKLKEVRYAVYTVYKVVSLSYLYVSSSSNLQYVTMIELTDIAHTYLQSIYNTVSDISSHGIVSDELVRLLTDMRNLYNYIKAL